VHPYTHRKQRIEIRWDPPNEELPLTELAHLIGDAVHALRSSLDYLVYELAIRKRGGSEPSALPPGHPLRKTGFPIFLDAKQFEDRGLKQLESITVKQQARITRLQPFGQPDHPLWVLSELDNLAKHRQAHVLLRVDRAWLQPEAAHFYGSKALEGPRPGKRLKPNTKVAVLTRHHGGVTGVEAQVNVALRWAVAPVFGVGSPAEGKEVVAELRRLRAHVTRTIRRFERDFPV
jgi:hypothetical protein